MALILQWTMSLLRLLALLGRLEVVVKIIVTILKIKPPYPFRSSLTWLEHFLCVGSLAKEFIGVVWVMLFQLFTVLSSIGLIRYILLLHVCACKVLRWNILTFQIACNWMRNKRLFRIFSIFTTKFGVFYPVGHVVSDGKGDIFVNLTCGCKRDERRATFVLAHRFVRHCLFVLERGKGGIFTLASVEGKFALDLLVRSGNHERASCECYGVFATDIWLALNTQLPIYNSWISIVPLLVNQLLGIGVTFQPRRLLWLARPPIKAAVL